jgi:capsular polysaccharide transport system permease protein
LKKDASIEDLTTYWRQMVSVYIEATSGIVTLDVRAFRREDALALTNAILHSSEVAVETLSQHVRDETVKHAEDEVQRSAGLVRASLIDLQSFRNAQGIIDPVKSAEATGKLLLQLLSDKIQLDSQIFVAQQTTGPNAPGVASLRARLDSTNAQIADLQQQMAGGKDQKSNLAAMISKFEELELNRQFAQKLYAMTQEGLVRARLAAERRAVYLTVFAPPALPEEADYPLRLTWTFLIAMGALLSWCSGATIWASIQDHKL